jgi:hypothetical protein
MRTRKVGNSMKAGLLAKATSLDMCSQCPEGAERRSSLTGCGRNVTRAFWGASAPETVLAVAKKPDEHMEICLGGAQRHESLGESRQHRARTDTLME